MLLHDARPCFAAPFLDPRRPWSRKPRAVVSIITSGEIPHKSFTPARAVRAGFLS
jgi:hypothetical protein